jgi:hypothetical protein
MSRLTRLTAIAVKSALLFVFPAVASAQQPLPLKHTPKPTTPAITVADAMTRVYIFADDSMLGREAGTIGAQKGTAYIEREARRMGLVPAGDNGTFFQAVPLYTRVFDNGSKLAADDTPLVGAQDYFPIHPEGNPKPVDGAQVIYVGNTADSATLAPAASATGKVVLFSGPTSGVARRYPGAVAYMVPRPEAGMSQIRNYVATPATGMKSKADTGSRPLTIFVPTTSVQKFLGVPIENARPGTLGRTLRGSINFKVTDLPARNVVAIIPGSDPVLKNQYVAFGAHSDHEGIRALGPLDHDSVRAFNKAAAKIVVARTGALPNFPGTGITPEERATIKLNLDSIRGGRPARLDSVYNGADDDASGSMGLLEIAEKFSAARVKPKRSLLFVWHTAEEAGLYGAEYFTDNPTVARDSIVAQLNIDMIGRGEAEDVPGGGPNYVQLLGSRRLSTEFGDLLEEVNKLPAHNLKLDYTYDASGHPEQYYCRSDHYEYARYGIPIVFMSTGGHPDYHQLTDEPQYISYPHMVKVVSLLADVGERVANLDHRLVVDKPKPDPKGQCVQ